MATIRNRGPYQWQATIRRRGYPVESRTFELRADAEAWARALESEMDRGVFQSRSLAEKTTLGELLDRYAKEVSPTKRGDYNERRHIAAIQRYRIAQYAAAGVDGGVIGQFRDEMLADGYSAATIVRRLAILSHVFNTAAQEWGIHVPHGNPVKLAKKPRIKNARDRRLLPGEEEELLRRARTYGGSIEAVIIVALETAMRRESLATLRWEQIDLKARVAHLPTTKNGDPQDVPLSTRAINALQAIPRRLDGWVFGMTKYSITQAFARICGTASAKKQARSRDDWEPMVNLRFHDLRHEATSRLCEKGLNPLQVAAITGHKTLTMLKRYTHLRAADLAIMLG